MGLPWRPHQSPPHPPYTHTLHHYPHHSPPSQATTTPPPLWLQTGQRKIKRGKKNTLLGETKMVGWWRKGKERRCCVHDWNSSLCLAWLFCSLGVLGVAGNFSCLSGVDCVCVCVPSAIIVPSMSSMIGSLQYSVEGNTVTLSSVIINVRLSSEPYKCSSLCTWSDPENLPSAPPDHQHLQHHKMCRKMDIYPCRKPNCICSKLEHS